MATPRKQRSEGAAHIRVTVSKNVLRVFHGDSGEKLLQRRVPIGFWCAELWPTLQGKEGK
jgi:hypothetical protein